ncbi:DUF4134 domain-containing protein [Niabella aurantiaca]|uniref:DUF4134 domain-containing protein n=1 Tax=Niabella aurantiaca TaxID=379900 RepID=UPI000380E95E|nr:DUF4134 domain-containing protein [Niabella aurantiaca]
MKMWSGAAFGSREVKLCAVACGVLLLGSVQALAQDGSAGIEEANTLVRQYFDTGINLMYAVGAVLGLIGAVRVYQRWSAGDPHTGQIAASWFGSCIFLVIVATVLRSFFGL